MFELINGGIFLAALTGLTVLAYKEPQAFRKLYPVLNYVVLVATLIVVVYTAGVSAAYVYLSPFFAFEKFESAQQTYSDLVPRWWVIVFVPLVVNLYLIFLAALPRLLENPAEQSPNQQGQTNEKRKSESLLTELSA